MRDDDRTDSVTLERIVPDAARADEATGAEALQLHLDRYRFAATHLTRGRVLDIACGVGYGTALLAETDGITSALGVDVDGRAISYAAVRYPGERVSYLCADALSFTPDRPFENIVSLETIEHVDQPDRFFKQLVSWLAPGGRLLASVPVTPSVDANPHHKTNFSPKSFRRMGDAHGLRYVTSLEQRQPYSALDIALRREVRAQGMRRNVPLFYLQHPSHLVLRVWSIMRDGFANKYLTVVWERKSG
jgi:SAM-dependent methyltransferase